MTAKEDIEGALLDVRKAYRLLYLYQRRVLDLCDEIVDVLNTQLKTTTLGFTWWQPCCGDAHVGRATTNIFGRSSWDFLTLCDFTVFYLPEGQDENVQNPGDWMFALRMTADDGHPNLEEEPDADVTKFAAPDNTLTLVRLYAYFASRRHKGHWRDTVVNKNGWPTGAGTEDLDDGFRAFGVRHPLSDLSSREAVEQHVPQFAEGLKGAFPEKAAW